MLKKFIILFVFCFTSAKSQSFVSEINVNIPKKAEAFQFQDTETKNTFLFFDNKEIISSYKLDENLRVVDSIQTNKEKEKIESVIGYAKKESIYYTYWSSKDKKTIYVLSYDFEKKESYVAPINFDIGKEYLINKIVIQNKFYIVTATKNTNNIHFYCFTDKTFSKKTISLNDCVFYDYQQNKISFYDLVSKIAMSTYGGVQNISEDNPASLVFASRDKKSYVKDNSLIFAFDNNKNYTQFLRINLDDYKYEYKLFSQPYFEVKEGSTETHLSNSFFVNDNLIQLKTNLSVLTISIKDMNKTEIKNLNILLDKEIDFKNSDIIQESMSIRNTRILDKSKKFLRRMAFSNLAASCYFENDTYYLTLGSASDVQNTNAVSYGGMIGGFSGALTGALIGLSIPSNYTMDNIESYNDRVVIYINCLFDKNYNHVVGEKKQLAFDKLRLFVSEKKLDYNIAFKLNEKLIYGGTKSNKKYFFYSFSDN
jgi:hypothetical protein